MFRATAFSSHSTFHELRFFTFLQLVEGASSSIACLLVQPCVKDLGGVRRGLAIQGSCGCCFPTLPPPSSFFFCMRLIFYCRSLRQRSCGARGTQQNRVGSSAPFHIHLALSISHYAKGLSIFPHSISLFSSKRFMRFRRMSWEASATWCMWWPRNY